MLDAKGQGDEEGALLEVIDVQEPAAKKVRKSPSADTSIDRINKEQIARAERSYRFLELLKFKKPATARAAIQLATDPGKDIDCSAEYLRAEYRPHSRSPAFEYWKAMWAMDEIEWSEFDEREAMESLLHIIMNTGGLRGYKISNMSDLSAVFPKWHPPGTVRKYRRCTFMLASYFGLCEQLFIQIIDRCQTYHISGRYRQIVTLFGRWQSHSNMQWPPLRNPMANSGDQIYLLELEASRQLPTPDAPLYKDRVSPLMAALFRGAWGAVYGLLERHHEIDLLAITSAGHMTSDYVECLGNCTGRLRELITALEERQLATVESTAPTCYELLDRVLPSVLISIVMSYWMPRLRRDMPIPKERPKNPVLNYYF
jgi:hypothetical protein